LRYTWDLLHQFGRAFRDIARDPGNRVVLLTGTGDEFVGPRADVAEGQFSGMSERFSGANVPSPSAILAGVADAREMQNALLDIAVPVVCAVNGPVLRHCEPSAVG
jgi:6-oxocamphor hydrolase